MEKEESIKGLSENVKSQFVETIKMTQKTRNLSSLVNITLGQSPNSKYYNHDGNGLPFYQGKKDFGEIHLQNSTVWTKVTTRESFEGDILINVRAAVGDVNLNTYKKISIGRGLAAINCQDESLKK